MLVISNRPRASRSSDFEITRAITPWIVVPLGPITITNRIYNKILDRDWFSARLFVTQSARDHVGVQLQVSDLNFL